MAFKSSVENGPDGPDTHSAMFARISSSRFSLGPLRAFAGDFLPTTSLSCCAGAMLPLLSTSDVLPLRATCREAAIAIAQHPWEDSETLIQGHVRNWRACFPRARAANLAACAAYLDERLPVTLLTEQDCALLAGLRSLSIAGRGELTDAAFAHLARLCTDRKSTRLTPVTPL